MVYKRGVLAPPVTIRNLFAILTPLSMKKGHNWLLQRAGLLRPGEFKNAFSAAAYAHVMKSYTSKKICEHGPRKTVPKQTILSNGFSFALRISVTQQSLLVGWEHLKHSWLWRCHTTISR